MTVVGNAELSDADRRFVASSKTVVRFNDMDHARAGDRATVRVVRLPSAWSPQIEIDAPVWYVAPVRLMLPPNVTMATLVYERQYEREYEPEAHHAFSPLFPSCAAPRCADRARAGPSTGAVVLSALSESTNVSKIHVLGMNWNGPAYLHVDFASANSVATMA